MVSLGELIPQKRQSEREKQEFAAWTPSLVGGLPPLDPPASLFFILDIGFIIICADQAVPVSMPVLYEWDVRASTAQDWRKMEL